MRESEYFKGKINGNEVFNRELTWNLVLIIGGGIQGIIFKFLILDCINNYLTKYQLLRQKAHDLNLFNNFSKIIHFNHKLIKK